MVEDCSRGFFQGPGTEAPLFVSDLRSRRFEGPRSPG